MLVLSALVTALFTYPLVRDLGHLLPDHKDPLMYAWTMVSNIHRLLRAPLAVFHGNTFYPLGNSVAFSDLLLTPTLFPAGPVYLLTGNPVLQYNAALLVWWALSAWAMYVLAYALLRSHAGAALAAAIFAFGPFRTDFYLEFQMQLAFPIPLALLGLWRFLHGARRRHLAAMLFWLWVEGLASMYYAIILGLTLVTVAGLHLLLRPAFWRWRPIGRGLAGGLVFGVALLPFLVPYAQNRRELGLYRSLEQPRNHYADVLTYLETGPARLYQFSPTGHITETSLFVGFVALGLALLALFSGEPAGAPPASRPVRSLRRILGGALVVTVLAFVARMAAYDLMPGLGHRVPGPQSYLNAALVLALARLGLEGWWALRSGGGRSPLGDRELRWICVFLILLFFDLSLGPFIQYRRHEVGKGLYYHIYDVVLPLQAMRITSRIGVIVVLAVALLAGLGLRQLLVRVRALGGQRAANGLAILAVVATLIEYAPFPLAYRHVDWEHPPAVYRALAADPDDVAVLEWPQGLEDWDDYFTFMSINHWKRLVNGASGFFPPFSREISTQLSRPDVPPEPFPTSKARLYLQGIHPLRYVVVHNALLDDADRAKWHKLRDQPWADYVGRFGPDDLYRLDGAVEGARIDKMFSWDFARGHKEIAFEVRALGPEAASRWLEVELNDRPLGRLDVGDTWKAASLPLVGRLLHSPPNVVTFRWRYEHPAGAEQRRVGRTAVVSPADLQITSGGGVPGQYASILVNGLEYAPNQRGYNVVVVESGTGRVRWADAFDTERDAGESQRLVEAIRELPGGTIVAVALRESAGRFLTDEAVAALGSLGSHEDIRTHPRLSHVLIGVKGAPPGAVIEELGQGWLPVDLGTPRRKAAVAIRDFHLR